jgi:hypothetical protein
MVKNARNYVSIPDFCVGNKKVFDPCLVGIPLITPDLMTILPREPIILPDIDSFSISHSP